MIRRALLAGGSSRSGLSIYDCCIQLYPARSSRRSVRFSRSLAFSMFTLHAPSRARSKTHPVHHLVCAVLRPASGGQQARRKIVYKKILNKKAYQRLSQNLSRGPPAVAAPTPPVKRRLAIPEAAAHARAPLMSRACADVSGVSPEAPRAPPLCETQPGQL